MICPNCKASDHELGAKYCHKCGTPLSTNELLYHEPAKPGVQANGKSSEGTRHPKPSDNRHQCVAPVVQNNFWHLIDNVGNIIKRLPYEYRDGSYSRYGINSFQEGLAKVIDRNLIGYIDKEGKEVIPIVYERGSDHFSEGLVAVKNNEGWGFMDTHGKEVIPFLFNSASDFSEGLAAVERNGFWGYIDHSGKIAIPFIFESADSFSEGLAAVEFNEGKGYINKEGRMAIPNPKKGLGIGGFIGKTLQAIANKPILRYTNGEMVSRLPYRKAMAFSEGFAAVVPNENRLDKYIFIDKNGDKVQFDHIENEFGATGQFSSGLCAVALFNDKRTSDFMRDDNGYIDKKGRLVHDFTLENAWPIKEGLAFISYKEGDQRYYAYINNHGNIAMRINNEDYSVYGNFRHGLKSIGKRAERGWKYGYIDTSNNLVIPCQFEYAVEFGE